MNKIIKGCIICIGIIISTYLILANINVNTNQDFKKTETIYLADNGMHVNIIIPNLGKGYTSYGWGSELFYMNVPTWDALTFEITFKALFTDPRSVVHIITWPDKYDNWIPIQVSEEQFINLQMNINNTLKSSCALDDGWEFFRANGNYNIFNTCNTWVNNILKNSGLKACLWTPFSKDIIKMYN